MTDPTASRTDRLSLRPRPLQQNKRTIRHSGVVILVCGFLASFDVLAQSTQLAVITTAGEVWVRNLGTTSVGGSHKLAGPSMFGGSDDRYVITSLNSLSVVTSSGRVWPRTVTTTSVGGSAGLQGTVFGGNNAKYVLGRGSCNLIYVVNTAGEVWSHFVSATSVEGGTRLTGPSLFGGPNDRYVVMDEEARRILVVTTTGDVWAHDITGSPNQLCPNDAISGGHKLSGPGLFGGTNDKYVVAANEQLYVVTTTGQVWAHAVSATTIGGGVLLSGPSLFGGPSDKYVVIYGYAPPQPSAQ